MSVFLSHSSLDKPFVRRLAVDLLTEGFPVWLDEWELGLGDSLIDRIYSGIGLSDYFVLVISNASIKSGWVRKEMTAALAKEDQLQRRILLPVVIDGCDAPLEVADRLYADFSAQYLPAFEALSKKLRAQKLHATPLAVDRLLIPMRFEAGTHLDSGAFERRLAHVVPQLPAGFKFEPKHFIVHDDEFATLRARIARRKECIGEDSYYTPDFAVEFGKRYQWLLEREQKLLEGICLILNNLALAESTQFDPVEVCKWFALIWRSSNLYNWWRMQNPDDPDNTNYGRDCLNETTGSDSRFYEVATVGSLDVGPSPNGMYLESSFRVYVDENESIYSDTLVHGYSVLTPVLQYGPWIFNKYVLPQMVARIMLGFDGPYTWTFERYFCGRG